MNIARQVTFESANRKKDRSVSLRFTTELEQSTDEFMEIDKLLNYSGVLVFSDRGKLSDEEMKFINTVEVENKGKSKSQRLRNVLYRYWEQSHSQIEFKEFYANTMEKIISAYMNKLE